MPKAFFVRRLQQRLDERQSALVAPRLDDLRFAAGLEPRRPLRRGGRQAETPMAFLEHVAVESNLLGDAAIVAANHTNEAVPTLAQVMTSPLRAGAP